MIVPPHKGLVTRILILQESQLLSAAGGAEEKAIAVHRTGIQTLVHPHTVKQYPRSVVGRGSKGVSVYVYWGRGIQSTVLG